MPVNRHLPSTASTQFRRELLEFRRRTGLGFSEISRASGLTWVGLHYIATGRRRASRDSIERCATFMRDYLRSHPRPEEEKVERDERGHALATTDGTRRCARPEGLIMTQAARIVISALDYCARRHLNGAVFGDPGFGKSKGMRYWSSTTKFPHAVFFCRAYTSYAALVRSFANVLGLDGPASLADLDEAIHEELSERPRMLVIDEADMLNARTLDWLRTIWDESGRASNFVLFAKPAFYRRLQAQHARSRQDLRQVWRRLAFRKFLPGIDESEMLEYLAARGLAAKLEPGATALLRQAIAGSFGDLEMMAELIEQMLEETPALQGRITPALVDKAREARFAADIVRRPL